MRRSKPCGRFGAALSFALGQKPVGIDFPREAVSKRDAGVGGELSTVVEALQPIRRRSRSQAPLGSRERTRTSRSAFYA
jgi:hypothetical protein